MAPRDYSDGQARARVAVTSQGHARAAYGARQLIL